MPLPPYLAKPRWLVGHVIVLVVAVTFVNLGFWQLRRLDERRQDNALVLARSARTVPLPEPAEALPYERVTVTGTYDPGGEALVRFRSREGTPGYEVLTPLAVDGGATVVVDRGWVPLAAGAHRPGAAAAPPDGQVTVQGLLAPPEHGSIRLERRPGRAPVVSRIDAADLGAAHVMGRSRLYPLALLADAGGRRSDDGYPVPVDPPDLGEGPHLSYAFQWFSFTAVIVVGWVVLLARRARRADAP